MLTRDKYVGTVVTFNLIAWLSIVLACVSGLGALHLAGRLFERS